MNPRRTTVFMILGLAVLVASAAAGDTVFPEIPVLERYVADGLKNNLTLRRERFSLRQALEELKAARGRFLPQVSIEARASLAGGGRLIDMPIGDLVNPIHDALNQLLAASGLEPGFPTDVPNEVIPFLREKEHETKLRLVQPVFMPALHYNARIKHDLVGVQRARVGVYRRQLVCDIKTAYFTHLKTLSVKELLEETRDLLEEALRVNRSLWRNHKVTEEHVLRARADLSQLEREMAEADKAVAQSAAYFNFLLTRPLDTPIEIPKTSSERFVEVPARGELEALAIVRRQEIGQLKHAIRAAEHTRKLHGTRFLPTVTAVVDYGFQGESYRFQGEDDYWMASLVLSWNLFNGFRDRAEKTRADLETERLALQFEELENQIRLQVRESHHNLIVAVRGLATAEEVLLSRRRAFDIVAKKYGQGMVPQIEYIQARDDFVKAGIRRILARFDRLIREAELERDAALVVFNHREGDT